MSIPEVVPREGEGDLCSFADRWGISSMLAGRLMMMASRLEFPISIISGFRSEAEQDALREAGRPTAPNDLSTHLSCPATGVDLRPQIAVTTLVKARLGTEGVFSSLRWGGGSSVDAETGIPSDWQHFDLGPRTG